MILTLKLLQQIQPGEVFKIVTTKYQTVHNPGVSELKFLCIKGHGYDDWAIYSGYSYNSDETIKKNGDKVMQENNIRSICPCTDGAYNLYRH